MRPLNKKYFNAVTGDTNGAPIYASSIIQISLIGAGTGTLAATAVKLQGSNDFDTSADLDSFVPTTWVDIPSATAALTAAGTVIIPKNDICYQWVRFVITGSSGAGTFTGHVKTNGV